MNVVAVLIHSVGGIQILTVFNDNVSGSIVAREHRINEREHNEDCKDRKDNTVDLLAEEYTENRAPVRISGRGDLLRISGIVFDVTKKFLLRQAKVSQIY